MQPHEKNKVRKKRKRVTIRSLILDGRSANREELEYLYTQYVCCHTCDNVLDIMSERELRRLVAIGIYKHNVCDNDRNRGRVIAVIIAAIGVSKSSLFNWFPSNR